MSRFGIYVHIPYCLQKCHYCDFVTVPMDHKISPREYVDLIGAEIRARSASIPHRELTSLYFGGGTPSVLSADEILSIRKAIANEGFRFTSDVEITVEINPGTVSSEKLDLYLAAGVTRFSVGVQTFNAEYLKRTGRLHSVDDSRELLRLLSSRGVNYSFDLLFGLPHQSLHDLERDLAELVAFMPPHVSLYNLTVPREHMMNAFRASDDDQAEMFSLIDSHLSAAGIKRYEISNFARPGFESRHNDLYWSDEPYWGLGVGAHSYLSVVNDFGARFWNPPSSSTWAAQVRELAATPFYMNLPSNQIEPLKAHEALTDFCHTSLRTLRGLSVSHLREKFGATIAATVEDRLSAMIRDGLLLKGDSGRYALTPSTYARANIAFLRLTFLAAELPVS